MSCGGCGSSGVLPGSLSARNRVKVKRVRGYSGSGILKSEKRLAKENKKATPKKKAVKETPAVVE